MMKFTALLVLLALVSAQALPTFKNKGGPPDVHGVWAGPFAGGFDTGISCEWPAFSFLLFPFARGYLFVDELNKSVVPFWCTSLELPNYRV